MPQRKLWLSQEGSLQRASEVREMLKRKLRQKTRVTERDPFPDLHLDRKFRLIRVVENPDPVTNLGEGERLT